MKGTQGDRTPALVDPLAAVNLRASMVAVNPSPSTWDALEAAVVELVAWHMTPADGAAPPPPFDVPLPGLG